MLTMFLSSFFSFNPKSPIIILIILSVLTIQLPYTNQAMINNQPDQNLGIWGIGNFLTGGLMKKSSNNVTCNIDNNLNKFYYYIEKLEIDLSGNSPIIKAFDIYAMSNSGLEAGWTSINSYLIPIHFVHLDVQNSDDFKFVVEKEIEAKTNLEHPGFKYKQKIGLFLNMEFNIEKIKFGYDSQKKMIYNLNSGIIGQTRIIENSKQIPEKAYLRISIKSEKSNDYLKYIKIKKQNILNNQNNRNSKNKTQETFLDKRQLRVDYPDDPTLNDKQFTKLDLLDKFIYQFLHGRTSSLSDDPLYNKIEKSWKKYAKNKDLDKYLETIFFEFTSTNPGENLLTFGENELKKSEIQNMFRFAHEIDYKKSGCGFYTYYPYRKWVRMPNDFVFDPIVDRNNEKSDVLKLFNDLTLSDIFTSNIVPSVNFFNVPEPNWTNNVMYNVFEAGIYSSDGVLTRYSLRNKYDLKFKNEQRENTTWFPFRVLNGDSQVVNILKEKLDSYTDLKLNISVDKYGLVLYSKSEVTKNENEKKMLWLKFNKFLFDNDGNSMIFMGKVLGFISFEKIKKILTIGAQRNFNYNGYLQLSNELNNLMERGFGRDEYKNLLKKIFKVTKKKSVKQKDLYNENKLLSLF